MSNTEALKEYLVGKNGYLLNPTHNGKTMMLSGAWGARKTHFWQNEVELKLSKALAKSDKSSTYISLYGKDSLSELKKEVFIKASTEKSLLSKEVSTFGFEALSSIEESGLAIGKVLNATKGLNNHRKSSKGIQRLQDGGVICFDDFERKSREINLNDLFGFISQLAIDMKCKVVIILNSDVFEGEEANVFRTVKEKTVNKFLYFEPTVEGLFGIIFEKYHSLNHFDGKIKDTFKEVGMVNARIFTQVLDNIQEWVGKNKNIVGDGEVLRYFILVNVNFILYHHIATVELKKSKKSKSVPMSISMDDIRNNKPAYPAEYEEKRINVNMKNNGLSYDDIGGYIHKHTTDYSENFIENLKNFISLEEGEMSQIQNAKADNSKALIESIDKNQSFFKSLHFMYAFKLNKYGHSHNKAEVEMLNNIKNFIETGIV